MNVVKLPLRACGLSALMCAAGMAANAQSTAQVYGVMATELVHVTGFNAGTVAAPQVGNSNRLDSSQNTSSRLGLRGTEDLGGGLAAFYNLESGIAMDSGTQANAKFWNRASFLGVRDNAWGALTAGRQFGLSDGINGRFFRFGGYSAFRLSEFGYISDWLDNSVKYVSPALGGLQVRALYAFGEGVTGPTRELAGTYGTGPLELGVAYRQARNLAGAKDTGATLGASYAYERWRVHGGAAYSKPDATRLRHASLFDIGLSWDATATTTLTFNHIERDQKGTPDDTSINRFVASYRLSKQTIAFLNLISLRNKGIAAQRFYGSGAAGVDQNIVSLGLQHAF